MAGNVETERHRDGHAGTQRLDRGTVVGIAREQELHEIRLTNDRRELLRYRPEVIATQINAAATRAWLPITADPVDAVTTDRPAGDSGAAAAKRVERCARVRAGFEAAIDDAGLSCARSQSNQASRKERRVHKSQ